MADCTFVLNGEPLSDFLYVRRFLTFLWLVAGTCGFTYWCCNSLLAMPLSEELRAWFNGWFDGQCAGTASDLEFIVVAGIGLVAAYCIAKVIARPARRS